MAFELQILGWAGVLAVLQLFSFAIPANRQIGFQWLAGPRDDTMPKPLSPGVGRLQRAFLNHIEGLVLFTVAVLVTVVGGQSDGYSEACAVVYLVARIVYVPVYWSGVPVVRSAVWGAGFLATFAMLLAALI